MSNHTPRTGRLILQGLAVALLSSLWVAHLPAAETPEGGTGHPMDRMARQIGVMEGILDQVLVKSPNFLVSGRDNARGLYLEGYGAVFSFEVSLLTSSWGGMSGLVDLKALKGLSFNVQKLVRDRRQRDSSGDDGDDSVTVVVPPAPKAPAIPHPVGKKSKHGDEEADPAELYGAGKEEILQTLLDYGDTLTSLRAGQWVVVACFLRDSPYFRDVHISRLILKAKIDDLRDYSSGKISESEMRRRVAIDES